MGLFSTGIRNCKLSGGSVLMVINYNVCVNVVQNRPVWSEAEKRFLSRWSRKLMVQRGGLICWSNRKIIFN